jgi:transketolase
MRKRILDTVYKMAKEHSNVVFIGSDLGFETLKDFKNEIPERFFMEGISEGHVVGMSAGLAMSGKIVYTNTIATFITRRSFEQNVVNLGLTNANVRLIGNGGGLVYAPLGPTHLAFEDIAIMRAIPNMAIIAPCDAEEMERATRASLHHNGPIYFRVGKGGDPVVSKPEFGFTIGKAIVFHEPGDVLLITTGIMLERTLKARDELVKSGLSVGVIHCPTVKPFDEECIIQRIQKAKAVVTVEEHSLIGGLGSIVSEIIAEKIGHKVMFKRIALPDVFPEKYGSQNSLIKYYHCDTPDIVACAQNLMR